MNLKSQAYNFSLLYLYNVCVPYCHVSRAIKCRNYLYVDSLVVLLEHYVHEISQPTGLEVSCQMSQWLSSDGSYNVRGEAIVHKLVLQPRKFVRKVLGLDSDICE